MDKIKVPEKLSEMSLGQLVYLGRLIDITKGEEDQPEKVMECIKWICRLTDGQVNILTQETNLAIRETLVKSFQSIIEDYVRLLLSGDYTKSFSSLAYEAYEIDVLKIRYDGLWANYKRKRELKKKSKLQTFHVSDHPAKEPALLWTRLLDNYLKKLRAVEKDSIWQEWEYLPKILSCVAWRENESRFTKDEHGNTVVDMQRVSKFEQVFLQIRAEEAIKACAFFLITNELYLIDPNLKYSNTRSMIQTLKRYHSENLIAKNGVLWDLLKIRSQAEMN